MAQIMTAALRRPWLPGFEAEVLTVMCVPVVRNRHMSFIFLLTSNADFREFVQS